MWVPRHQTLARGPNVSLLWLFALLSDCSIPTPGSLWDWSTFLLEANAPKQNTRPAFPLAIKQAFCILWDGSSGVLEPELVMSGRLSIQFDSPSLNEPSVTSHTAGCWRFAPKCVLACSF